jgi:phosphoglycerate kinase
MNFPTTSFKMTLNFNHKKALIRVDFNVPLDKFYKITDDTRIREALPTIKHILQEGGAVILMSHFGRPLEKLKDDGSINKEKFTLRHLVAHLSEKLNTTVQFADDCIGEDAVNKAKNLKAGEVLLLENTRFYKEEEKGNEDFAKKLAALGDIYVNDAFGSAHRAHASTTVVAKFFDKTHKSFGFLMEREVASASRVINNPARPVTAIIGGAKVSDKILLLDKLLDTANHIIIGGGMAYTFMKAEGGKIGNSLCENDRLDTAKELLAKAKVKGVKLHFPQDSVIADKFAADANTETVSSKRVRKGWMGLDIGEKAVTAFTKVILSSKTILWNGPMGVFELPAFANGTKKIAEAVAEATQKHGAFSLVGGGDSVAAVNLMNLSDKVSYVSTGGGAMLEFLEGKVLPGIQAIQD